MAKYKYAEDVFENTPLKKSFPNIAPTTYNTKAKTVKVEIFGNKSIKYVPTVYPGDISNKTPNKDTINDITNIILLIGSPDLDLNILTLDSTVNRIAYTKRKGKIIS